MSAKNNAVTNAARTITLSEVLAHKGMFDATNGVRGEVVAAKVESRIGTLVKVITDTDKQGGTAFQVTTRLLALGLLEYAKAKNWVFDDALLEVLNVKTKKITPYKPKDGGDGDDDGDGV